MLEQGITPTMSVAPAGQSDGMFGNSNGGGWIWILLLFFLLSGRGFGAANEGVAASPATNLINNDFLYTQSKIDSLAQNLINQTNLLTQSLNSGLNDVNQNVNNGFNSVNMGLCTLGHQIDRGFCDTNRNIDQVRFENAQNTCTITNAIGAGVQSIKDLINSNTVQELRDRNVELANALNNSQQTASIVSAVRPYPQAAYLTANPNAPCYGPIPFYGGNGGCCNPCCG